LTISEGITPNQITKMIYDLESAISYGVKFLQNVKERMDVFIDENGPAMIIKYDIYKDNYIKARRRGAKIRFVTEITKHNIQYCKELRTIVDEFRHLDNLKGSIAVNDFEFLGSTTWRETQLLTPVTYSNEKEVIEQQRYIFDTFWKKAISFDQRIMEIEEGIIPKVIETFDNSFDIQDKILDLLNSANNEILIISSSSNAFHRQKKAGSIQKLLEISQNKPWIAIKILTPKDIEIENMADKMTNSNFTFRFTEPLSKVSFLMVDRKYSLVVELKDDSKKTLAEAKGFAIYSNSTPTVSSYAAIFNSLWKQAEMYQQLKIQEKMQKEFINTAAHELRTPVQPIIGITEIIRKELKEGRQKDLVTVISRNAQRLKKLSEDIIDITRIESNSLNSDKEHFEIKELILHIIINYKNNTNFEKVKFDYILDDDFTIYADRIGISRVISNLIDNSIKFSPNGGIVSIILQRKDTSITNEHEDEKGGEIVIVSVKDTGIGIGSDIFPKLFTKFITKSFQGMGLGLFISKNIVEAHGGRIWAENNKDGKGATFSFSLPLYK
jgi:two-component system, OmpR family, sensor histidine kinase VicK